MLQAGERGEPMARPRRELSDGEREEIERVNRRAADARARFDEERDELLRELARLRRVVRDGKAEGSGRDD